MKKFFRVIIFLVISLLFIACGPSVTATPSQMPPTATVTATFTPIPSPTATATVEPTPTQAYIQPTLIPTIDPTLVPDLLWEAFSIKTMEGVNGHSIKQITGWNYGFRQICGGYQWLDSNHLMLFPIIGQYSGDGRRFDKISPVVINLETGQDWLPPYEQRVEGECDSAQRSLEHGFMVFSTIEPGVQIEQDAVSIRTLDGEFVRSYRGKLIAISPSGTKILISDDTWIDLISGEIVDFDWYRYRDISPDVDLHLSVSPPIWSSDETQVLICCYFYGNARTGKTDDWEDYNAYNGTWVLDDSYLLLQYHLYWGADPGYIPLYDPATNTILNLNQLAGLPVEMQCPETSVSPNGKYVWVMCYGVDYLVDLSNYRFKDYPGYTQVDINWSADGNFAWIDNFDPGADSGLKILSVTNETLTPLPVTPTSKLSWHPTDHILAYLAEKSRVLTFLNVQDMSVKSWKLPSTFEDLYWSPDGRHIALTAADGSLWQIDYPKMEIFEQLTPPMPDVRDVFSSPDGNSIAFVSGSDIYIVDTIK